MNEPLSWVPGEHVAIVGQTGSGKTHLIDRLVRENRQYVVVFKTKDDPEDKDKYWRGFKRVETVKGLDDTRYTRFLLHPPLGKTRDPYEHQAREFWRLIDKVFKQGGWTVVFDEQWYIEHFLKGKEGVEMLLTQGRSKGISVVMGAQRPVEISRFALSQASHVVMFRGDRRDADTLGRATSVAVRPVVESLREHDFAYWHQRTRSIVKGNARSLTRVVRAALADARPGGGRRAV